MAADQRRSEGSIENRKSVLMRYPWISTIIGVALIGLATTSIKVWATTNEHDDKLESVGRWIMDNEDSVKGVPHLRDEFRDFRAEQRVMNGRILNAIDDLAKTRNRSQ